MITLSNRNNFLGIHTTAALKAALKEEASQRDISMSQLAHRLLSRAMHDLGYDTRTGDRLSKEERRERKKHAGTDSDV